MPANIYSSVKQALQDIIAPQLGIIEGKIESLRSEIKRIDSRIDGIEEQMRNLREELHMAIDIHERIATIEAKVGIH